LYLETNQPTFQNAIGTNQLRGIQKFGYARTSTTDQKAGFDAQIRDLKAAGAEKIFSEQVSSAAERAELDRLLAILRPGDVLVVTKLDRLARSVANLVAITATIEAASASLRILTMSMDTATATGKLMLNVLSSVAEFERCMMLERQREGIAKARREGKYKGRKPLADEIVAKVRAMHVDNRRPTDIARALGIGRTSVYRALER
jgi:DNA invertase Pin-like site-specific DNA recombinase